MSNRKFIADHGASGVQEGTNHKRLRTSRRVDKSTSWQPIWQTIDNWQLARAQVGKADKSTSARLSTLGSVPELSNASLRDWERHFTYILH